MWHNELTSADVSSVVVSEFSSASSLKNKYYALSWPENTNISDLATFCSTDQLSIYEVPRANHFAIPPSMTVNFILCPMADVR